jgi:hypothetical protein
MVDNPRGGVAQIFANAWGPRPFGGTVSHIQPRPPLCTNALKGFFQTLHQLRIHNRWFL